MIDDNGYNYNEFLSDSSDDYPKYSDGFAVNQSETDCYDEDGNFEPYSMVVHSEEQHKEIISVVNNEGECELGFQIKQVDDEMLINEAYNQPFHAEPPSNLTALENVLSLAEERCEFLYGNISEQTGLSANQVIADDSILAVRAMLNLMKAGVDLKSVEASNIALAQDQDNL